MNNEDVLVRVVPHVDDQRQIEWRADVAERLTSRIDDIERALAAGSSAVAKSLPDLAAAEGWRLNEIAATFGISLTAEAGVIVSKAEAGATFEVSVIFSRE